MSVLEEDLATRRERIIAELNAKVAKERDIRRLGGIRAYEDFTVANYTNFSVLEALGNFPAENYFLWGKAGVGKTHAAVAVARLVKNAKVVRMCQISRHLRALETTREEEQAIKQYAEDIMVIDDLGSEKMTEYLQNLLFEIMDRRWQTKKGGLIITSNVNIVKLGELVGDRTASRIAGLVGAKNVIEVVGKDWRLGGAK